MGPGGGIGGGVDHSSALMAILHNIRDDGMDAPIGTGGGGGSVHRPKSAAARRMNRVATIGGTTGESPFSQHLRSSRSKRMSESTGGGGGGGVPSSRGISGDHESFGSRASSAARVGARLDSEALEALRAASGEEGGGSGDVAAGDKVFGVQRSNLSVAAYNMVAPQRSGPSSIIGVQRSGPSSGPSSGPIRRVQIAGESEDGGEPVDLSPRGA
jgi:hypothetical protein